MAIQYITLTFMVHWSVDLVSFPNKSYSTSSDVHGRHHLSIGFSLSLSTPYLWLSLNNLFLLTRVFCP